MDDIERCSCGKPLAECPEGLAYAITRRDDARAQLGCVQDECSKWRGQADHLREATEAVLAAAEPFAVGNHEVPTGLLDALAKAAGVPTLSER